jgi:prepilin-type N-terminal cleavage/methylation domain-containing protein
MNLIDFPFSSRSRCRAFTLSELMVAVLIGCVLMVAMAVIFVTSSLSFARMGDYINMDRASRKALDQMSCNIRQAKQLTSFDPALLTFNYDSAGTTNLAYRYNSSAATLTEEWTYAGDTTTNTLLTGCSNLTFALYDRTLLPTTGVAANQGKVLSVAWQCTGSTLIAQKSSENMQQAKIVLRNQP